MKASCHSCLLVLVASMCRDGWMLVMARQMALKRELS